MSSSGVETPIGMLLKEFRERVRFIDRKQMDGTLSSVRARELEQAECESFARKLNDLRVTEVRDEG